MVYFTPSPIGLGFSSRIARALRRFSTTPNVVETQSGANLNRASTEGVDSEPRVRRLRDYPIASEAVEPCLYTHQEGSAAYITHPECPALHALDILNSCHPAIARRLMARINAKTAYIDRSNRKPRL